jgi:hypothetical protein
MEDVTRAPRRTAPRNSAIAARMTACHNLSEREDTDVANELATSFAPILYASRKAKMKPIAKR